jgi:lipopolysaccharide/colanic/teichoic acid biosynthesis glycosyltransferase
MEQIMNENPNNFRSYYDLFYQSTKRCVDVVIGGLLLLILSPILIVIAVMIKLDSRGPVIYRHLRIGRHGKPFYLYKFRSMTVGGDDTGYMEYLRQLIESEQQGEGIPYRKMSIDARVTRIGGFLRTYYLDEIPQLLNIIKGDMSLVGPRPHVQFEVDHYTTDQSRRLLVRPGATGLWQVDGKADCTFNELIDLDLDYIENRSLVLDFLIILKTLLLMARGGEGFWARMEKRIPNQGRRPVRILWKSKAEPVKIDSLPLATEEDR